MAQVDSAPTTMLDHALAYLRRGLPVFPVCGVLEHNHADSTGQSVRCTSRGKVPLVQWKPFQDRLPTEAEVRRWWAHRPDANIGLATGHLSGLVVLDLDGDLAVREALARGYDNGPHAFTGRVGGQHRYFAWRPDAPRNFAKRNGIDYRGEGGFVILPPSRHVSGRLYVWGEELGDELPELPEWVDDMAAQSWYPGAHTADVVEGDITHDRNVTLTSMGGSMRRRGMSEAAILAALRVENETRCKPPLDDAEVSKVAHSIARYDSQSSVPSQSVLVGTELDIPVPGSNSSKTGLELNPLLGIDAAELREQDAPDEVPSLPLLGCDGYIILGWSNLLAAYPRTGKTELLAACIPTWLNNGHRVLYLTEEPLALWRLRLRRRAPWPPGCRIVAALGIDPARLLAELDTAPEDIVVVDAIRNLLAFADENDNSEVARKINPWVVTARQRDKTLELVHHLRKGAGDHGEGIAGGHALLGAVDIALELLFDQHGITNRRRIRAWARLVQPAELLYEQNAERELIALGDPASLDQSALEERVLDELSDDVWRTTSEVHDALGDPKPSQEGVRVALTALSHRNLVDREPPIELGKVRGKAHRWKLPSTSSVPTKGLSLGTELPGHDQGAPAVCALCEEPLEDPQSTAHAACLRTVS